MRGTVLLGLMMLGGCSTPGSRHATELRSTPAPARDRVHVLFVESPVDVLRVGDVEHIATHLRDECGIANARYIGNVRGEGTIAENIRRIRHADPDARIVLVGWSSGSWANVMALRALEEEGLRVDTLVHLDSITLNCGNFGRRPPNADRVVAVYRRINVPVAVPHDEHYCIDSVSHLNVPHRRDTVDAIANEVLRVVRNGGQRHAEGAEESDPADTIANETSANGVEHAGHRDATPVDANSARS